MIRKLHIQLTALCTAITGLILATLTVICLLISESGMKNQETSSFQTNLNTLYENLELQTLLSHNWIRQMEYHYQFHIRVYDNGQPLFYQNLEKDETVASLVDEALQEAADHYDIHLDEKTPSGRLPVQKEFTIRGGDKELYNASVAVFSRTGGSLGVAVLHSLAPMSRRIFHQRLLFLSADLVALLALIIFFWFFTARMIRPIQENRKKQIQFVASASHELRSPLTVILSNIAAVRSHIMPCDDSFLLTLDSEGKRMSRLISDMLQLASADNHTWSIHPEETELDTLLLQTWENFESLAAAKGLSWDIELPDEAVPPLRCDSERVRQLLSILIDNAFCYTPKGGRVVLALRRQPGTLHISVSDNGPGIPDDQKSSVFERFHRLDCARRDKSHFGLGLCIADEIVRLHRGNLLLTDTPGGGATFTVVLDETVR